MPPARESSEMAVLEAASPAVLVEKEDRSIETARAARSIDIPASTFQIKGSEGRYKATKQC